jgi:hypothetical protein
VWASVGLAIFTAIYPVIRAFYRVEITYNEGWNVYNASALANHQVLYPASYGWITVNYPILSFAIAAALHRFTHDYLFTARALSLLGTLLCGVFAGSIVRKVTGSQRAAWITGAYCIAVFCALTDFYVGQDDPQMLALAVFMGALLLYVVRRKSWIGLAGVAALFVIGGNIKHDPLAFPAAVLLDLVMLRAWRRVIWFCACGTVFAGISVWLNLHFGGPGFFLQLAAPRAFFWAKGWWEMAAVFGPLLLPFVVAVYTAAKSMRDDRMRVLSLLLFVGLGLGVVFGGGAGVSVNAQFPAMLAMAMLSGVALVRIAQGEWNWAGSKVQAYAPAALLVWLVVPLIVCSTWNISAELQKTAVNERLFDQDVAFLREQSGSALCESLLRCYFAGKAYKYDPFNSTRLISFGKLDDSMILEGLQQHRYGAVQLDDPWTDAFPDRFNTRIASAIKQNYRPALVHEGADVYVPR